MSILLLFGKCNKIDERINIVFKISKMARMVTRSMRAKGYCVRFPSELPTVKKQKINHKKLREFMNRERVRIIYRDTPMHSMAAMYIHCFGNIFAFIYCFTLYVHLFHYIYTHPLSSKESKQLIAYWINGDTYFFTLIWMVSRATVSLHLPYFVSILLLKYRSRLQWIN